MESGTLSDDELNILKIILAAINDWPNPNLTLEDYERAVSDFIGAETNKNNIEKKLKGINLYKFAWQAESLSELIEIFQFYKENLNLKDIFARIANR